jgi:serine/threonine protein kinase
MLRLERDVHRESARLEFHDAMFSQVNPPTGTGKGRDRTRRVGSLVADRYRIDSVLGQGGVGTVYEVTQVATGERLALKALTNAALGIPNIKRRFEREAKATSRLSHPNIVDAFDFGSLPDGSLYMVMELVRGISLAAAIDAHSMNPARSFEVTRQMLGALTHAHAQGVIHRDLKPDNVMLVGDGASETVKLLDFGIAKLVGDALVELGDEDLTMAGVAFGSPEYMSPEQATGQAVDGRADLYAVGIMLVEMLTGRRPFESHETMETVRQKVSHEPPRLVDLAPDGNWPPELEAFIARAIARNRDDRFANADEMREALAPLAAVVSPPRPAVSTSAITAISADSSVDGLASSLEPVTEHVTRTAPVRKTNLRTVFLIGAALLLVAGGAALALTVLRKPPSPSALHSGSEAPTRSPLAEKAQRLITAGDAKGAVALLEAELAKPSGQKDAWAKLVLGHGRFTLGRPAEALVAYREATAMAPPLAKDQGMRTALTSMVQNAEPPVAVDALDVLAGDLDAATRDLIVEQASHSKRRAVRRRAIVLAERSQLHDKVDWLASYSLELSQAPTCQERLEVVAKLRALGDKKAIPELKRARSLRRGRGKNAAKPNECLERDATAAIQYLDSLPK